MKEINMNRIKSLIFTILVLFAFSLAANGQLIVIKKPVHSKVIVVKPVKPGKKYVWIDGHWKVRGNKYVWIKGRWVKKRPGKHWVKGRWKRTRGGWVWIAGYWK